MPKKTVSVEVESSPYDLMVGLGAFVKAVKAAHANGASLTQALPADITAAVADLVPLVGELSQLGPDLGDSKAEFIEGINLGAYEIVKAFTG